jgi:hypothetical protein
MKAHTLFAAVIGGSLLLTSCGNSNSENTSATGSPADSAAVVPMPPVALADVSASPDFPGASLAISSVKAEKVGKDSAKLTFAFDVKNYELKMQTSDNANKLCNNSDKGQHIHFILDNQPYKALYEPKNEITLPNDGAEHYLMAFLSRSYHESIKAPGAALVYHFKVDEKGNLKKLDEPKMPMIFYSRPKGDYFGKDTANLLLDFYVWNCRLSADSLKVKAEISNNDNASRQLTATLDKWQSHFIQNLSVGKSKVVLTLMGSDGQPLQGPQTNVSREFSLIAAEPGK